MSDVKLEAVQKIYDDGTEAVKALDLYIGDGELAVLVGPSGCGKTTALRMIAGLEEVTAGTISIAGKVVNHVLPSKRDIAMVFQSYALYPHMSVRDNIGFPLRLARVSKGERRQRVDRVAKILGLEAHLGKKPRQLSGGQRQRVAMGRAIIREPRVFLMDEPLSNLDAKLRVQMRGEIASLQRELAITTVYVTHDQVEAMTMGDRVVVMRRGELQQVGTPQEVYDRPCNLFVAGFIGSPPMNLVPGSLVRNGDGLAVMIGTQCVVLDATERSRQGLEGYVGRTLVVGVRAEHLADAALETRADVRTIVGDVRVREALGSDVLVHCRLPGVNELDRHVAGLAHDVEDPTEVEEVSFDPTSRDVTARFDPRTQAEPGRPVRIALLPGALQLFDPQTGHALLPESTRGTLDKVMNVR